MPTACVPPAAGLRDRRWAPSSCGSDLLDAREGPPWPERPRPLSRGRATAIWQPFKGIRGLTQHQVRGIVLCGCRRVRDSPAHAWFQVVRLGLNSGDNALWITLWVADLRHCSPLRFVPRRRRRARHDPLNYELFTTPLPSTTLLDYSHIAVVGVVGGCVGLSGKRRLQGEGGEPCGNGMYFLPSRS